jgi:F420H(2)-dependent quinone reductase
MRGSVKYFEVDGSLFIVASNGGAPRHPAWYLNLVANPTVAIQRGREVQKAMAAPASPERRAELWQRLTVEAPMYARYQHNSAREIPIVLLQPVSPADATAAKPAAGQR